MKRLVWLSAAAGVSVIAIAVVAAPEPEAADHADSPSAAMDAEADIADLYAFTDAANPEVSLIMTFGRGAAVGSAFPTDTDYIFNLTSSAADGSGAVNYTLTCTFPTAQTVSCTLAGGDLGVDEITLAGDIGLDLCAPALGGVGDDPDGCNGALRVFADVFDDPFFFNAAGFTETVETVQSVASTLEFSDKGCPFLDADVAEALVDCLGSACNDFGNANAPAVNAFADENVRAIVVEIERDAIDGGGNRLAVWASTEVAGVQIDRAGRPAISTALIGTFGGDASARGALKDQYNAASNRTSWDFTSDIETSLGILDALNSTGN